MARSDTLSLDEELIKSTFDALVADQVILYGSENIIYETDLGFEFEFRVCPAFLTKPSQPDNTTGVAPAQLPTYGPGSDLYDIDDRLTLTEINETHRLILNRFCAVRPQYLLLTLDSYKRQTELLEVGDLLACWTLLNGLPGDNFIIYNCGPEAGCSRIHKHMQAFPVMDNFRLFPDKPDFNTANVPYQYLCQAIKDPAVEATDLALSLHKLYLQMCGTFKTPQMAHPLYFPHNLVLTKRWIMVIPRRQAQFEGISANAAGMLGMPWVATQQQIERWLKVGPSKVLSQLGLSPSSPSAHS